MESYRKYKEWWIKYQAPYYVPSLYYGETAESAFEQHIKNMGLYELMEILLEQE
jgi:hypothetical protein